MSIAELRKQIDNIDKELDERRELKSKLRGLNILSELGMSADNVTDLMVDVECKITEPEEYTCSIVGFVTISYNYGDNIHVESTVKYMYDQTYQTREYPSISVALDGNVTGVDESDYSIGEYYIEDYEEGWGNVVNDILEYFYNGGKWDNLCRTILI